MKPLVCAFGTDWRDHAGCPGCHQFSVELQAQFAADVAAGKMDADGYTPADRRRSRGAQARRQVHDPVDPATTERVIAREAADPVIR